MAEHRLQDGPNHVVDGEDDRLPAHYEATFRGADGSTVRRFLTDKDRAWLLVRLDEGDAVFSDDELASNSAPPDLDDLVARMEAQSGEGA